MPLKPPCMAIIVTRPLLDQVQFTGIQFGQLQLFKGWDVICNERATFTTLFRRPVAACETHEH